MLNLLEPIFNPLIVWHNSMQLMATNKLTPKFTRNYLRHRSENAMVATLNTSQGIFIHWGVYETGKSTSARHAAQRLQDDHDRTVIFRKGYDLPGLFEPDSNIYTHLGLPSDCLAQLLVKPTTLIIDHFDSFVWSAAKKNKPLMRSLLGMMAQARETPRFNVLLIFNSWECAKDFKDTTDAKLVAHPHCGRWTEDELTVLRDITHIKHTHTPENRDEILRLAITGGSPGLLHFGLNDFEPLKVSRARARIYENEWTQGTLALTGGTPLGPGRFPDKEGKFHWDPPAA
jgi:hypothetical protein